jgi:hypothetical protein
LTVHVAVALITLVPALRDVIVIVHVPAAVVVHELASTKVALPLTMLKFTSTPGAGTEPLPAFWVTVAVMVWFAPTAFVAVSGDSEMLPSTKVFWTFEPSRCKLSPVVRVMETPLTVHVAVALITLFPALRDVIVIVHVPAAVVVHEFPLTKVALPVAMLKFTSTPGAGTEPAPVPASWVTVAVMVWFAPTAFVAVSGDSEMLPSTKVFWTFEPSRCKLSPVVRVMETPLTVHVAVALITLFPALRDVIVIVHVPAAVVVHEFASTKVALPVTMLKFTSTPGAGTEPLPAFWVTVAVMTWFAPTAFVAVSGDSEMLPSTTRRGSSPQLLALGWFRPPSPL